MSLSPLGEMLPQCCLPTRGRKVKERIIERRKKTGGWVGQWRKMNCFGVSLELVSLCSDLKAVAADHELSKVLHRFQSIFFS